MTVLRKAAVRVSEFTALHASAGSREWAEGLAREVEFIDSDWRALAWAAGSTRVLLEREAATTADGENQPKPLRFVVVVRFITSFMWTFLWVLYLLGAKSRWDRISWCLILFASAYYAATSIADWRRERWEPPISDLESYWLFGRKELELELARSRTARRWFPWLAIVSAVTGWSMRIEGLHMSPILRIACIALGVCLIWARLPETPAKIQRQIEQKDAWIAEARSRRDQPEKRAYSDHWGRRQSPTPESTAANIQI